MKTNTLLTLLMVTAIAFVMGCDSGFLGGGPKVSGWQSKIDGTYKSAIFTGSIEFPGTTTFKTSGGEMSGTYELTAGGEKVLLERIPGTKDQPHKKIKGGGHFLQEGRGEELAQVVIDFLKNTG